MGTSYQDILYEKKDGVAKVTINRPKVLNAFRPLTIDEMRDAFHDAWYDTGVGVVVLTGANGNFCSGGDVKARGHGGYSDDTGQSRLQVTHLHRIIREIPKPVIAMVDGYAIGGGHVLHVICDLTIASESAYLITGEARYLDLIRSQLDMLLEHGREENGQLHIPHRYKDGEGWTDYGPPRSQESVHLWAASMEEKDWQRLEKLRQGDSHEWTTVSPRGPRSEDDRAWIRYLAGDCPGYPEAILQANYQEIRRRVQSIQEDQTDMLKEANEHHWQQRNPVVPEALVQLTTGGPQSIYWGGLSRGRLRHFDAQQQRPGLPQYVAALVSRLDAESVDLKLVNLSVHAPRDLIVQAGTYGEHRFGRVEIAGEETPVEVNDKTFQVRLLPGFLDLLDADLCFPAPCGPPGVRVGILAVHHRPPRRPCTLPLPRILCGAHTREVL